MNFAYLILEETGYIQIKVKNRADTLKPQDIDISEVKDVISDIENFLYPTRSSKKERPKVSYDIEEGSIIHKFFLPITAVIYFQGLINAIEERDSVDFLDFKRASIIQKFQKKAIENDLTFIFNYSLAKDDGLEISYKTNYIITKPEFYETELYLYGEVYNEGGKNPNVHVETKEYGNVTVYATKQQLKEGEKRLYEIYGLKVSGKKSLSDGSLSDLKLIEFIDYNPSYNESLLDKIITNASKKWKEINDVDIWLNDLRGGVYE